MSSIKSFEEIEAWQYARKLAEKVHLQTQVGPFVKDFSLWDQINRSSGSVMDNIAEGFERGGSREFLQFLSYARGSCAEMRSQLYRALDRKYLSEEMFTNLKDESIRVSKMITGFMYYLRSTKHKGFKFHSSDASNSSPSNH